MESPTWSQNSCFSGTETGAVVALVIAGQELVEEEMEAALVEEEREAAPVPVRTDFSTRCACGFRGRNKSKLWTVLRPSFQRANNS